MKVAGPNPVELIHLNQWTVRKQHCSGVFPHHLKFWSRQLENLSLKNDFVYTAAVP